MAPGQYLPAFRKYKEENGCADCGLFYPHYMLEFDHLPGSKKVDNVYRVLKKYGVESAWQEVAKCEVVCANCHKRRTYEREQDDILES